MTLNCQRFNFQADCIVCQSTVPPNIPALAACHGHSAANTAGAGLNRDGKTERMRTQKKRKEGKRKGEVQVLCVTPEWANSCRKNGEKSLAIEQQQ